VISKALVPVYEWQDMVQIYDHGELCCVLLSHIFFSIHFMGTLWEKDPGLNSYNWSSATHFCGVGLPPVLLLTRQTSCGTPENRIAGASLETASNYRQTAGD